MWRLPVGLRWTYTPFSPNTYHRLSPSDNKATLGQCYRHTHIGVGTSASGLIRHVTFRSSSRSNTATKKEADDEAADGQLQAACPSKHHFGVI